MRDKVFALLGLSKDRDSAAFIPDYKKTVVEVYTMAMRHSIKIPGQLDLLCYNTNSAISDPPLPSWVSDWRSHDVRFHHITPYAPLIFNACRHEAVHIVDSDDQTLLQIGGLRFDEIADVTEPAPLQGSSDDTIQVIHSAASEVQQFLTIKIVHILSQGTSPAQIRLLHRLATLNPDPRLSDSFWRTIVCD